MACKGVKARIGLAVPGRPDRSLVAQDRSAAGVRDPTGPEFPMLKNLPTSAQVGPGSRRPAARR
jgi:hypothetical protein